MVEYCDDDCDDAGVDDEDSNVVGVSLSNGVDGGGDVDDGRDGDDDRDGDGCVDTG